MDNSPAIPIYPAWTGTACHRYLERNRISSRMTSKQISAFQESSQSTCLAKYPGVSCMLRIFSWKPFEGKTVNQQSTSENIQLNAPLWGRIGACGNPLVKWFGKCLPAMSRFEVAPAAPNAPIQCLLHFDSHDQLLESGL